MKKMNESKKALICAAVAAGVLLWIGLIFWVLNFVLMNGNSLPKYRGISVPEAAVTEPAAESGNGSCQPVGDILI